MTTPRGSLPFCVPSLGITASGQKSGKEGVELDIYSLFSSFGYVQTFCGLPQKGFSFYRLHTSYIDGQFPTLIVVPLLSHVQPFETPWTAACQASLSFTISQSLLKLMSIESVMPSNSICYSVLLLPSIFPSIRVFSNESTLYIRWSEYWIFSFSISPSKEYSAFISFRIDWLDLLAVQGTLKSILHLPSPKTSAPWH